LEHTLQTIPYLLRLLSHRVDAAVCESFGDLKQASEHTLKAYELMDEFAFIYFQEICEHLPLEERQWHLPAFLKLYPEYEYIFEYTFTRSKKNIRFCDSFPHRREDWLRSCEETLRYSREIRNEKLLDFDDVPGSCLEGEDGGWADDGYEED
jgi:hypothetical protein